MKRASDYQIRPLLVGFVATVLAGGAGKACADFTFGRPINLGPNINTSSVEIDPSISADGLELFFESRRPGGYGLADVYVSRRASKDSPWGPCMNIGARVNTAYWNQAPSISADGLSLYFSRFGGPGVYAIDDLWVTTRQTRDDPWEEPTSLGAIVNSSSDDWAPSISADGLTVFFASGRPGGFGGDDLWSASRATKNDPWGSPVNLGAIVNSPLEECFPDISADRRMLFFSDHGGEPWRPGGYGWHDLWVTARATTNDPWGEPVNLGPVINSSSWDVSPNISADGSMLYFASGRPGGIGSGDIWQAPIIPVVDFNSDGIVDTRDLVILIEHWGQANPQCDIGPNPLGDGKVDEADLEVLMGYWGQPVDDPTLMAHWALDETEGVIASDSAGGHDGIAAGTPLWRPEGGQVKGALELNGTTFLEAPFVLSPSEGAFSVLAWIKGGAPGQTILSQANRANWLMAEATTGALMTELRGPGRSDKPLASVAIITDGNWHRITFTWDSANRRLYVDGALVAEDTQDSLARSTADLLLGTGKTLAPGTF